MTLRQQIADIIADDWEAIPELAAVWVIASQDDVSVDARVTAVVSQTSIGTLPEAPMSHRRVGMSVAIVSPSADTNTAAEELEPLVYAALNYLDKKFQHEAATVSPYGDRDQFAYRIPLSIIAKKEA